MPGFFNIRIIAVWRQTMAGLKLEADVSNVLSGIDKIAKEFDKAGIKADSLLKDLRGIPGALQGLAGANSGVKLSGSFNNMSEAIRAARKEAGAMQADMEKNIKAISDAVGKLQASFGNLSMAKGFDQSKLSSLVSKLSVPDVKDIKGVPNIRDISKKGALTNSSQKNVAAGANEIVKVLNDSVKDYMEGTEKAIRESFSKISASSLLQGARFSPVQQNNPLFRSQKINSVPKKIDWDAELKDFQAHNNEMDLFAKKNRLINSLYTAKYSKAPQTSPILMSGKSPLNAVTSAESAIDEAEKGFKQKVSLWSKIAEKLKGRKRGANNEDANEIEKFIKDYEDRQFMEDPMFNIGFTAPRFNQNRRGSYSIDYLKQQKGFSYFDPSMMEIYGATNNPKASSMQANTLRAMAMNNGNLFSEKESLDEQIQTMVKNIAGMFAKNTDITLGDKLKSQGLLPPNLNTTNRQEMADTVYKVMDKYFNQALKETGKKNGLGDIDSLEGGAVLKAVRDTLTGNDFVNSIKSFGFLAYDPSMEARIAENQKLLFQGKPHVSEQSLYVDAINKAIELHDNKREELTDEEVKALLAAAGEKSSPAPASSGGSASTSTSMATSDSVEESQLNLPKKSDTEQIKTSQKELSSLYAEAFNDYKVKISQLKTDIGKGLDTDTAKKSLLDARMFFGQRVKEITSQSMLDPNNIDKVLRMGDMGMSKVAALLNRRGITREEAFKNPGVLPTNLGQSAEAEIKALSDFVQRTTKAFSEYGRLLDENAKVEGGKPLTAEEMQSSRDMYAGIRDISSVLSGTGLGSKAMAGALNAVRNSVYEEGKGAGTSEKKNDYVPKTADKDRRSELGAMGNRLKEILNDSKVPEQLKEVLRQSIKEFEAALRKGSDKLPKGSGGKGGGSYRNSEEYLKQKLKLDQQRADNYGKVADAAQMNARNRAMRPLVGGGSSRYPAGFGGMGFGSTGMPGAGFFGNMALSMMHSMPYGGFNLGMALRQGAMGLSNDMTVGREARNFARGGSNSLLLTNTMFDEKLFEENLKGLDGFKGFVDKVNERLKGTGQKFSADKAFDMLRSGELDRNEMLESLSGSEKKKLRNLFSGDRKGQARIQRGLMNDAADRATVQGSVDPLKMAVNSAGMMFVVTAVTKLAKGIVNLGKSSVQAFENIEKLRTQMSVVFSSESQSAEMFGNIKDYAKKTPFGVEQTTQQAILLRQSGVYASDLMDTIKRLGDMSSGNADKLKTLTDVYARVTSSMTVTARDLRQLSNAGVASYKALADATGIQQGQIRSRLQAGKITSVDFQKMVKMLTDEGGMFYGATERGAKTLAGRKQRLSDTITLAKSELGETLAKAGGTDVTNSILGDIMGLVEGIANDVADDAKKINDSRTSNAAEKANINYQNAKKAYEDAVAGGASKKEIAGRKDEMDKALAEWEKFREGQVAVAVEAYSKASPVLEDLRKGLYNGKEIQRINYGGKNGLVDFDVGNVNDFLDSFMAGFDGNGSVVDYIRKKAKNVSVEIVDGMGGYYDEVTGEFVEVANTETKSLADVLVDSFQNALAGVANEVDKSGKAAADALDGMIRAVDVKISDVEDIDKKLNELTASQNRMSTARTDWNQSSPIAQMMLRDANAARDENLKQRIMYYENDRGILDKETGKYNLGKLDLNEFKEAEDLITANAEQMELGYDKLWDDATNSMVEGAEETLNILKDNFAEVYSSLWESGAQDVVGSEGMQAFKELNLALQDASRGVDKEGISRIVMLLKQVDEVSASAAADKNNKFGEALNTSYQRAKTVKTRDTESKKYINKRKNADLWAQIISQTTGVSAERVQLSGAKAVMGAYTGNFARRDMFSTLGKSLMQNGASLKELSDVMKANKKGNGYDWIGASNGVEELAAKRSVETQDALINAYQQQIDTLNNLEMAGVATRDQWDNLGSLSAQLGVGFSLAAEEMADGSYRFTEATIKAAEDMKRELNLKKFVQQLDNVFNRKITELNKSTLQTNLQAAFVGGGIDYGRSFNTQDSLVIGEMMAQQFEYVMKENIETLVDAAEKNMNTPMGLKLLESLAGKEGLSFARKKETYEVPDGVTSWTTGGDYKNTYIQGDSARKKFMKFYDELLIERQKTLSQGVAYNLSKGADPTIKNTGGTDYYAPNAYLYATSKGGQFGKTQGGLDRITDLLTRKDSEGEKARELLNKSKAKIKDIEYKSAHTIKTELKAMSTDQYLSVVNVLTELLDKDEIEKRLLEELNSNQKAYFGTDGKTIMLDTDRNMTVGGKKTSYYGGYYSEWEDEEKHSADKTKLATRYVITDEVKELFKTLQDKLKSGNLTNEEYNKYIQMIQMMFPKLMDSTKTLKESLERNTLATNKLAAAQETSTGLDKIQEFYKMTGRLGLGKRETFGTGHRASYDAKAFGDMEEYAPGRMHINTFAQDRMLEWLGLPSDVDFNGMLGRYSENFVPKYARDRLQGIKEGETPQSIEELYIAQLKTEKLIAEDEEGNALKDEFGNVKMADNLTDEQQARFNDFTQEKDKNLLAMGNFSDQIGAYLVNNKNGIIRGVGKDAEGNRMSKEDKQHLKELLTPEENELGEMELGEDKMMEALALLDKYGVGIDELVEKWARFAAAQVDSSLALKQMGENMKNAFKDAGANAILDTTKLIGENMYKIENSLMTQEEATTSIKKSLAGQAAALLDQISKEAVITGLRLIGAGALESPVGWGMIAAGIGLAAAGGFGSIASGLLSGYASDNSKNTAEEEIARLESLRDNLADLLKQAKDDAEYYEKNLRAKQAFQTNESVSATRVTKTNDMILSPQGVFSTHPDDYIMAMKDPSSLMSGSSPNVSFCIINNSGAQLNVESTKQTKRDDGGMDIEVVVNGIVQKAMMDGEYDQTFAAMQAMQQGAPVSA